MAATFALLLASCAIGGGDDPEAAVSASTTVGSSVSNNEAVSTIGESPDESRSSGTSAPVQQPADCEQTTPSDLTLSGTTIVFYASCGIDEPPFPIYRNRNHNDLPAALASMTEGLNTAERDAGVFSWFDLEDVSSSIAIGSTGIATVTFERSGEVWKPGASTSSQVASLVDPIAATIFAFPEVRGIDRSGLCFGELVCDGIWWRAEFEQTQFINHGLISTRSCGSGGYWDQPNRCSVDGVRAAGPLRSATVIDVADDDTLNMRAGPSADAFIMANSLRSGAVVQATEIERAADDGGIWRLIVDGDRTGWVNNAFLDLAPNRYEIAAEHFIAFAMEPDEDNLARLRFTDRVQLGLGPQLLTEVERGDLAEPGVWVMDVEYFRAYVGPFSIIERLQNVGRLDVGVGPHKHCAGDPMPVPVGLESATIVSIQPAQVTIDSCLQWFTVDLFIDGDDRIQAVTLDMWEP